MGLNLHKSSLREYFNKDPVEVTTRLAEEGKIATRPVRGVVMLCLPEDAPASERSKSVLTKILEDDEMEK